MTDRMMLSHPLKHRSGLTPQSPFHHQHHQHHIHNPSASTAKPPSMVIPSTQIQEPTQLPTPNHSGPTAMPADEDGNDGSPQDFSGRGKRLTLPEQKSLFHLCEQYMNRYDAHEYPKSFWMKISELLLKSTGRKYSWQSCRRRIQQYVEKRKAFWAAFDADKTLPDLGDMDEDLASDIDDWMTRCELRVEKEEKERREKVQQSELEQAELARALKLQRTFEWAKNLPPPEEMERQPSHWGMPPHRFVIMDGRLLQGLDLAFHLSKVRPDESRQLALDAVMLHGELGHPQPAHDQKPKPDPSGPPLGIFSPCDRKRPHDAVDGAAAASERPARRPRTDLDPHPQLQPRAQPGADDKPSEKRESPAAMLAQKNVDRMVNSLWLQFAKGIAPYYEEHRDQPQTNKQFGLVLYDLYRDLGRAFSKAVNRLVDLDWDSEYESESED
ncbi:uncharacterized protein CDV56_107348 [Aspergillus thermomutatus]|uniref:Uncharacterized protein n=1 Tax=Aspergillus thermomutatus TaxID=41047 RepID=A0A397HR59_ASPTH|nr:uncharacterized protein CDV56_107348 [Aspergillus thermomutatus]RHZ65661.1 hypothetical protein CDV56_107348 [Aspergillus thermomutatus]